MQASESKNISRKSKRVFKPGDVLIISIIIALSIFTIFSSSRAGKETKSGEVTIEVNGKTVKKFLVERGGNRRVFSVEGVIGVSKIEVKGEKVRMVESACRDKICVRMGWIDSPGQNIVCLPNRVVIRYTSPRKTKVDSITE
ncbi:MAG: NusG domain II-containing protein [Actinomycetota bacterium]|nr:NusG domain II-containing protein [Actinomycetota bacterium]